MKTTMLRTAVILSLLASTAVGASEKITCRETGKTMDKCCCEMNDGKFYCKLTKKAYDQCCCDMK